MKFPMTIALAVAALLSVPTATFAEEGTTLAGGDNGGAGMHGATTGAAKRETVMPKSGEAMTGSSTTTGAAAGTGESKGTATGGNPGGNASKN